MSLRPVCKDCRVEMDIEKNGVAVIGKVHNKLRLGDRYKCPECGSEIITGFGRGIYQECLEGDFEEGISELEKRCEELVVLDE